jgi:hypothetical protein
VSDSPTEWNPQVYGPLAAELLGQRIPSLDAGKPEPSMRQRLAAVRVEELFAPRRIVDSDLAQACLAAVWLWHDFLDESHTISQQIDRSEGSYWHALMHRREGDFSNSKYWLRRVGEHAVFVPLHEAAQRLAAGCWVPQIEALLQRPAWDALGFVDLCAAAVRGAAGTADWCRQVQAAEFRLLWDHCYRGAVGGL